MEAPKLNLELTAKIKPKLQMRSTVKAWGPKGQTLEFRPESHVSLALWCNVDDSLTGVGFQHRSGSFTLESIIAQIEAGYEEGQPLYIKDNRRTPLKTESVFRVIGESEFIAMDQSDVQEILRKQHLVITDMRHREQNFEEALLGIAPLDWVTGIQGKYISVLTWWL